jgi:hypothetical protein
MYNSFPDIIERAECEATAIALEDRKVYDKYLKACEKFAIEHDWIAFNIYAPDGTLSSYQYTFYGTHITKEVKKLAEILYDIDPQGLSHYTVKLTKILNSFLTINVNGREIVKVKALPVVRGFRSAEVIETVLYPGHFQNKSIQYAGPLIQLMPIYSMLTNPFYVDKWEKLLVEEKKLRGELGGETAAKTAVVQQDGTTGGFAAMVQCGGGTVSQHGSQNARAPSGHGTLAAIIAKLTKKYITGFNRVLIGTYAILQRSERTHINNPSGNIQKLQVITANPLQDEAAEITQLLSGYSIMWKIDELYNPLYPKLRRMTFHFEEKGRRHLFLDVYNSAEYNTIPYTNLLDVKIGTPFVIMLYKLIDIFSVKILAKLNLISAQHAENIINGSMKDFMMAADFYTHDQRECAQSIFPLTYIGRYENEDLAIRRLAYEQSLEFGRMIPYYPTQYRK